MSATPAPSPPPATAEAAKNELLNKVNSIITAEIPDIAEDVEAILEKRFKGELSKYLEALKRSGKTELADITKAGIDMLAKMKKELSEMVADVASKKMTMQEAANKAVNDFINEMNLDPKYKDAILHLGEFAAEIKNSIKEGKSIVEDIKAKMADSKKNAHAIIVDAVRLMEVVIGLITAIVFLVVWVYSMLN